MSLFLSIFTLSYALTDNFDYASPPFTNKIYLENNVIDQLQLNINSLPYIATGQLEVMNLDVFRFRSIDLRIKSRVYVDGFGKEGWIYFDYEVFNVDPGHERNIDFAIYVPDGVCDGNYNGKIITDLIDYDNLGFQGIGSGVSYSRNMNFNINTGNSCNNTVIQNGLSDPAVFEYNFDSAMINVGEDTSGVMKLIYHDFDGDQVYEPEENDVPIDLGTAYLYDSSDSLISTTDLSVTNGVYAVPSTALSGIQDFYLVVETDKSDDNDPSIKDTLWEGNLFVDRTGSYASQQNVYLIENVSSFSEIIDNIDVRSRNTDQSGTWDAGSITVGPDDKDQIISPIHWDQLVAGTDFPYVDLDHDGRIDPDDKDHIISPLYWDFPN